MSVYIVHKITVETKHWHVFLDEFMHITRKNLKYIT